MKKATAISKDLDLKQLQVHAITKIDVYGKQLLISFDKISVRIHLMVLDYFRINEKMENGKLRPGLQFEKGENAVEKIREMTSGRGADVCVDAVGFEPERSFPDKVKATVNFEKGSIKVLDACFETVRCQVLNYIDHLIQPVKYEKVVLNDIISHTLPLSEVSHAYDIIKNKGDDCVNVVLKL